MDPCFVHWLNKIAFYEFSSLALSFSFIHLRCPSQFCIYNKIIRTDEAISLNAFKSNARANTGEPMCDEYVQSIYLSNVCQSDNHTTSDCLFLISFIDEEQSIKMVSVDKIRKNYGNFWSSTGNSSENIYNCTLIIDLCKTFHEIAIFFRVFFHLKILCTVDAVEQCCS